jgi:hypothetical protein
MSILTNSEFDESQETNPFAEELKSLADKVAALQKKNVDLRVTATQNDQIIERLNEVIQQQETAIILLKEHVLKHGLPAFWDPQVTTTLKKPIQDMTVGELIERNRHANKYKRAASAETAPFPTAEELIARYTPKKPTPVSDLMDAAAKDETATTVHAPGEVGPMLYDDDPLSIGMGQED